MCLTDHGTRVEEFEGGRNTWQTTKTRRHRGREEVRDFVLRLELEFECHSCRHDFRGDELLHPVFQKPRRSTHERPFTSASGGNAGTYLGTRGNKDFSEKI